MKGGFSFMHIYIIRHGETYGNLNGDGFSETDLTPKGEEQARLLGERFKDKKLDKIYTSPLIRAVKTAKEIKTSKLAVLAKGISNLYLRLILPIFHNFLQIL